MDKSESEFCPKNKKDWRDWLSINHESANSIWLIIHKKGSVNPNLSWSEAVDEALCFGWIDSVKKSIDDQRYKQYFSKRKLKSSWSNVNKKKIEKLMKLGLMAPSGMRSIEIAKNNGSWNILDTAENLIIPKDLDVAFKNHGESKSYFESLSPSKRKFLLTWISMAKRPATRQYRIEEIVKQPGLKQTPQIY